MNVIQQFFQTGILETSWAERIGWTLLHSLWQIGVIAGVYALVAVMLRKRSAKARYLLGCVTLLGMVCLPVGTYLLLPNESNSGSGETVALPVVEELAQPAPPAFPLANTPLPLVEVVTDDPPPALPSPEVVPAPVVAATITEEPSTAILSASTLRPWMPWATAVWLLGVCLLSLRPILGWLHIGRLQRHGLSPLSESLRKDAQRLAVRLGVTRAVYFVQSTLVEVPTVVGFFRPFILLPASAVTGLATCEIEMILAHELAHIRRHDYLVNLAQTVLEALLFFHPAMWWVSRQVRKERENCCDDIAVAVSGNSEHYVLALTRLEEQRTASSVAVLTATGGSLLGRVRRLLGQPCAEFGYRSATAWSTVFVMLSVAIAFSITWAVGEKKAGGDKSVEEPPAIQLSDQMSISANPIQAYQPVQFKYELTPKNKQGIKRSLKPRPASDMPVKKSDEKDTSASAWESWGEGDVKITRLAMVKQGKTLLYHQEDDVTADTIDELSVWKTTSDQWSHDVVTAERLSFSVQFWRYCTKVSPDGGNYVGVTVSSLFNNQAVPVVGADWKKAVTQAFPDWGIVGSGRYEKADRHSLKASRILLEKVRREQVSSVEMQQQKSAINAQPPDRGPGDPNYRSVYSHIELITYELPPGTFMNTPDNLPWTELANTEELHQRTFNLGKGFGRHWFVKSTFPRQHTLRTKLDLREGDDPIQLLVDALFVEDRHSHTSRNVMLPLANYGDEALSYIERAIQKADSFDKILHLMRPLERIHTDSDKKSTFIDHVIGREAPNSDAVNKLLIKLYEDAKTKDLAGRTAVVGKPRKEFTAIYLDLLKRRSSLRQAANACISLGLSETKTLLWGIYATPKTWDELEQSYLALRNLEKRPISETLLKAEREIHRSAFAKVPDHLLEKSRKTLLTSLDKDGAVFIAARLAHYHGFKVNRERIKTVQRIGRQLLVEMGDDAKPLVKKIVDHFENKNISNEFEKIHQLISLKTKWGENVHGLRMAAWSDKEDRIINCLIRNHGNQPVSYSDYTLGYFESVTLRARPVGTDNWTELPRIKKLGRAYNSAGGSSRNVHVLGALENVPVPYSGQKPKASEPPCSFTVDLSDFQWPQAWQGGVEVAVTQKLGDMQPDAPEGMWAGSLKSNVVSVGIGTVNDLGTKNIQFEVSANDPFKLSVSAKAETDAIKAKLKVIETQCVPAKGTTREDVEKYFGKGKLSHNYKGATKPATVDSRFWAYEFFEDGILFVRYDNETNTKVLWAHYSNPYSTKGRALGIPVPPQERLRELNPRLKQMEAILIEYQRRFPKGEPWGDAVEGVRCLLRSDRAVWKHGVTPTFKIDIHNDGPKTWALPPGQMLYEIEVDGRWYQWTGSISVMSPLVKPGKGLKDIPLHLAGNLFQYVDQSGGETKLVPLRLSRGRHTIRVACSPDPKDAAGTKKIRVVSNPVAIDVVENVRAQSHRATRQPKVEYLIDAWPAAGGRSGQLVSKEIPLTTLFEGLTLDDSDISSEHDTWLLMRGKKLNMNDSFWVDRIERTGNRMLIHCTQAEASNNYKSNIPYRPYFGVNLGRLEAGKYDVEWRISPMSFVDSEFDLMGRPKSPLSASGPVKVVKTTFSIFEGVAQQRANLLKAKPLRLHLALEYHGAKDKSHSSLIFYYGMKLDAWGGRIKTMVDASQAKKIIDHLAAEGFLAKAGNIANKKIRAPEGPSYTLKMFGPRGVELYEVLGWGAPLIARLKSLHKVLEGDAAVKMGQLLKELQDVDRQTKPSVTVKELREAMLGIPICAAVCEATGGARPESERKTRFVVQGFKVLDVLAGYDLPKITQVHHSSHVWRGMSTAPKNGDRVICVLRPRFDAVQGAKLILPDTPANRVAVASLADERRKLDAKHIRQRTELIEKQLDRFHFVITYHGSKKKNNPLRRSVMRSIDFPTEENLTQTNALLLSTVQVRKLLKHLGSEGFLLRCLSTLGKDIPSPPDSTCTFTLYGPKGVELYEIVGKETRQVRARLKAIRKALKIDPDEKKDHLDAIRKALKVDPDEKKDDLLEEAKETIRREAKELADILSNSKNQIKLDITWAWAPPQNDAKRFPAFKRHNESRWNLEIDKSKIPTGTLCQQTTATEEGGTVSEYLSFKDSRIVWWFDGRGDEHSEFNNPSIRKAEVARLFLAVHDGKSAWVPLTDKNNDMPLAHGLALGIELKDGTLRYW